MAKRNSKIVVNRQKLKDRARDVREFADYLKNKKKTGYDITLITNNWKGEDADAFLMKWNELKNDSSAYNDAIKSLEAYAKYLEYAAEQYRKAQEDAYNRANRLPR